MLGFFSISLSLSASSFDFFALLFSDLILLSKSDKALIFSFVSTFDVSFGAAFAFVGASCFGAEVSFSGNNGVISLSYLSYISSNFFKSFASVILALSTLPSVRYCSALGIAALSSACSSALSCSTCCAGVCSWLLSFAIVASFILAPSNTITNFPFGLSTSIDV